VLLPRASLRVLQTNNVNGNVMLCSNM
jgi:hypothetical protein